MSDWNGKGSKSRVKDLKAYWDSPLWKKKEEMNCNYKRCLFLDDWRKPEQAELYGDGGVSLIKKSGIVSFKWDVVKSYKEFVEYINSGIPDVVSFDHDLEPSHYTMEEIHDTTNTGFECAEYLINACRISKRDLPKYYIHSASPWGRQRIKKILEEYENI